MPLIKEKTYTIDDIYALPEDERAELIDGQIYYMAPPTRKHQDISMELSSQIKAYVRSKGGQCKVYAAPFAVYLDESALKDSVKAGIYDELVIDFGDMDVE